MTSVTTSGRVNIAGFALYTTHDGYPSADYGLLAIVDEMHNIHQEDGMGAVKAHIADLTNASHGRPALKVNPHAPVSYEVNVDLDEETVHILDGDGDERWSGSIAEALDRFKTLEGWEEYTLTEEGR